MTNATATLILTRGDTTYAQRERPTRLCGGACPLLHSVTARALPSTGIAAPVSTPHDRENRLYCLEHGTVWCEQ